jgi:hypothetical protein
MEKVANAFTSLNLKLTERAENLTLTNVIDLFERLGRTHGN